MKKTHESTPYIVLKLNLGSGINYLQGALASISDQTILSKTEI